MNNLVNMYLFLLILSLPKITADFNPFTDSDIYTINWAGPTDIDKLIKDSETEMVTIKTEDNEKYHCVLPESQATINENRKAAYKGDTPEELMEALFSQSSCSYRIESYWTYELCHGKHIKQYHENKELGLQKPKNQEYYLGRIKEKQEGEKDSTVSNKAEEEKSEDQETQEVPLQQEIRSMKVDGLDLPYFSVNMSDGTMCDLTGKPRRSHVMYICQPNGRGEIYLLKETSTCEYDIVVLTSVLCTHPDFKPKDPPVSEINCFASEKSPLRPTRLSKLESTSTVNMVSDDNDEENDDDDDDNSEIDDSTSHSNKKGSTLPPPRQDTTIGSTADKQLLRDFLLGDYCLHGTSGWWKHEFCYKKSVRQYHEEADGVTEIFLGYWNKQSHLKWLERNPSKRPKPVGERKVLSMYYSGGDICDLTGAVRFVEVRLKCLNKPNQPHAVTIYLVEPKTCEYTLVVESPIFCDLLDKADDNGLLDHIQV